MADDHQREPTPSADEDLVPEPPDAPVARRRGPFDLTDQQKVLVAVILVVHLVVARFTLRDLRRRPASAVRGPKRLWRLLAVANTTGSLAYWVFGRRRLASGSAPPR